MDDGAAPSRSSRPDRQADPSTADPSTADPSTADPSTVEVPVWLIDRAVAAPNEWPPTISSGDTPVARAMAVVEDLAALAPPQPRQDEAAPVDLSERTGPGGRPEPGVTDWQWVLAAALAAMEPRAKAPATQVQDQPWALLERVAASRRYKESQDSARHWASPRDPNGTTSTPPFPAPGNAALEFLLMVAAQFLAVDADVTLRELASNAWMEGHVEGYDRAMGERHHL